jgi:hypothetical protein
MRIVSHGSEIPEFWLQLYLKGLVRYFLALDCVKKQKDQWIVNWVCYGINDHDYVFHELLVLDNATAASSFFQRLIGSSVACLLVDTQCIEFLKILNFQLGETRLVLAKNLVATYILFQKHECPSLNSIYKFFLTEECSEILKWNVAHEETLMGLHKLLARLWDKHDALYWARRHQRVIVKWMQPTMDKTPLDVFNNIIESKYLLTVLKDEPKISWTKLPRVKRIAMFMNLLSVRKVVMPPRDYHFSNDRGLRLCLLGYLCSFRPAQPDNWARFDAMIDKHFSGEHRDAIEPLFKLVVEMRSIGVYDVMVKVALARIFSHDMDATLKVFWDRVVDIHNNWCQSTNEGTRKPKPVMGYWDVERPYVTSKEEVHGITDVMSMQKTNGVKFTMQLLGPIMEMNFSRIMLLEPALLFEDHRFSSGHAREVYVFNFDSTNVVGVAIKEKNKLL